MAVVKRGNGFEAECYIDGKRFSKRGFKTKKEANKWIDEMRYRYKPSPVKEWTMDDLIEKYEKFHLPEIRSSTQTRYVIDLTYRIKPYFKFMRLANVTTEMVKEFRASLLKDLSPKSINNCTDLLSSIFNLGIEWKMVEHNPVKIKRLKVPPQEYEWWENWSDIERFLKATRSDRYGACYRLALECGLRQGEIIALEKEDIDFERSLITINKSWDDKEKKLGPPKHNKVRVIGFNPESELVTQLHEAIERSRDPKIIFTTRTGKRQGGRKLYEAHQGWIERLKLPEISFHDLRHTFASWFMIREDNIWELMKLLGHASIKTTMKYAHLSKRITRVPSLTSLEKIPAKSRQFGQLTLVK